MSIANYLTALDAQRDQLARNLVTMGVQASESEKLNTLVPKVLQIPSGRPEVTLFCNGNDALTTYGESIYTFYIDGYRSIAGFADVYPHFCCAENDYALYYNQPDFNWGQTIYTMCVEPIHISSSNKIMMSYKSGATDIGEMWLVPKNNDTLSPADTARYIRETIMAGQAVGIPFNWLQTADNYTTVLIACESITSGEYYLAWKAVSDNTHPYIRTIKILEETS